MRTDVRLFLALAMISLTDHAWAADMAFPGKDWEEATPQSQGLDGEKLAGAVAYLKENSGRDGVKELVIIPGASHLFEEPGTLEQVAERALRWFLQHVPLNTGNRREPKESHP